MSVLAIIARKILPRVLVDQPSGCWIWQGELNRNGYGRVWIRGRRLMVHRVVWEILRGPIAEGLVLDHTCRTRACCNPCHLDPVTVRENTLRGEAKLFKPRAFYVIEGEASHV